MIHWVRIHPVAEWQSRGRDQMRLWTVVMRSCLLILLLLICPIDIACIILFLELFDLIGQLISFQIVHLSTHCIVVAVSSLRNLVKVIR